MAKIVTVRLLDVPYRADRDYDYLLPPDREDCPIGSIAVLPFGTANRTVYAVVTDLRDEEIPLRQYKTVSAVLPEEYRILPEILRLCFFLRDHTLCSVGDAVRAAFPTAALGLLQEVYFAAEPIEDEKRYRSRKAALLSYIRENPGITRATLLSVFDADSVKTALPALVREGRVLRTVKRHADAAPKTKRFYTLNEGSEGRLSALRGSAADKERRACICRFLSAEGGCFEDEILSRLNISPAPLRTLVKGGVLTVEERETARNPYALLARERDTTPLVLSSAQKRAYDEILSVYEEKRAACVLLHGVTGSGKTKVMIQLLDRVFAEGKQAILLVPEIALTPQTVGVFCRRYGESVSVLHSSLSVGERFDAYRRILAGESQLVIGTRSAVFAPLSRLGVIIIDEEHEYTYKSDASPRYHTRDVAAFRSAAHGAMTLLASATPAIESYYKAKTGKYHLVSICERYGGALLPQTEIVDMKEELRAGNTSCISRPLYEALAETVGEKKQAVLFLNRRGYYHAISCRSCGEPLLCPHCSVAFTYHTDYAGTYLLCHACGTKRQMPEKCPSCDATHLAFVGIGTQKVQAELSVSLPDARVLRMDADTTAQKTAYERILHRFRKGEADLLLGTQMVTKGHDFPKVALSGVLLADSSLYMHDFRAAERTFSLLTQVIGRAGRAKDAGRAIIQTYSPDHAVIRLAAKQDYPAFYEQEIAFRKAMAYPPFCDIVTVGLSDEDEGRLLSSAAKARELLISLFSRAEGSPAYAIYGPLEMGVYKVAEKYRVRLLVKCRLSPKIRALFGAFLDGFGREYAKSTVFVDFNPTDT